MAGPFGDALMRYSRVRVPGGGAQFGGRAPNADAIRMSTPSPGAIKPSEAASEAQLPPEIKSYLSILTGIPGASGAAAGAVSPPTAPAPPMSVPPMPMIPEQIAPAPVMQAPAPTVSKAMVIRAPRPPEVDVQVLGITQPDGSWQAAFYDRNGRRANATDYQMRAFAADQIARTGHLPTKAEWLFQRFQNLTDEPGGISEFASG